MQKYFITKNDLKNHIISGDDCHHISNVMRFKVNDRILVSDGEKSYLVSLKTISSNEVSFEIIEEQIGNVELPVFVSIFQGYPKADKIEEIINNSFIGRLEAITQWLLKR